MCLWTRRDFTYEGPYTPDTMSSYHKEPYHLLTHQMKLLPIYFIFLLWLFDHMEKKNNKLGKLEPRSQTVSLPAYLCGSRALQQEGRK